MTITKQPDNQNFLSPTSFHFEIQKLPMVNFFVQSVNIPSVALRPAKLPNPFVEVPVPGDHLEYGNLVVTFKLDEELKGYKELQNWIRGLGFPDNFDQYKEGVKETSLFTPPKKTGFYSDAILTILTNSKNPKYKILFRDIVPTQIGDVLFAYVDGDIEYLTCTATFAYTSYEVSNI